MQIQASLLATSFVSEDAESGPQDGDLSIGVWGAGFGYPLRNLAHSLRFRFRQTGLRAITSSVPVVGIGEARAATDKPQAILFGHLRWQVAV